MCVGVQMQVRVCVCVCFDMETECISVCKRESVRGREFVNLI